MTMRINPYDTGLDKNPANYAPLTPLSVAGVARRSAYGGGAASSQQQAVAPQQAATAQAPTSTAPQQPAMAPAPPASALPVGTIVGTLPSGCTTVNLAGKDYFDCGGTLYRAGFQSGNVVYLVSEP